MAGTLLPAKCYPAPYNHLDTFISKPYHTGLPVESIAQILDFVSMAGLIPTILILISMYVSKVTFSNQNNQQTPRIIPPIHPYTKKNQIHRV